ncbi:MAG: hypothetical protein H7246_04060 [Phycisphaerae bacterium]|nr:hypothetical protein [Saprospiraceae bacterium]
MLKTKVCYFRSTVLTLRELNMNDHQLRQWLADGKTERVLDGLLQAQQHIDPDLHHEATLLSARFENLARQKRLGTLNFQDENRERAQINAALLEILNRLEKQPKRGFFANPLAKWGSILVATIGVLGGIAEFSGWSLRDIFGKKPDPASIAQPVVNKTDTLPATEAAPSQPNSRASTFPAKKQTVPYSVPSADTALTITCKSNKGRLNLHFKNGETMRFFFKVSQACTVRSIYKLADGRLVLLDNDRPVSAAQVDQWLEIGPGFEVSDPFGDERVFVFAQNAAFEPLVTTTETDGYLFIKEGLPEALRKSRGFKKKRRFAEDSVMLRTSF